MIKAINTFYNGHYFRSRLEARVAVFLDELKLLETDQDPLFYDYEPEGYATSEGPYLPDFYVENLPVGKVFGCPFSIILKCFLEVKGTWPTNKELKKAQALADETDIIVGFIIGTRKQGYLKNGSKWPSLEASDHLYAFKKILLAERLDKEYGGDAVFDELKYPNLDYMFTQAILGGYRKVKCDGPIGSAFVDFWVTPKRLGKDADVRIVNYGSPDIYARPARAALSARFEHGEKGALAGRGF